MAGLQVGLLLAGVVVVEAIFARPGVGLYTVQSSQALDYPAVAGVTIILGAAYVLLSFLVDLAKAAAGPRIRV